MPIYRRKGSPYWWYSISLPGRGRLRGSTQETDERKALLFEADLHGREVARPGHDDEWRLREVLGAYWAEHGQHLGTGDEIFFKFELLNAFLDPDLPLRDLTSARLMDYRAARRGGAIRATEKMIEARATSWKARFVDEKGFVRGCAAQTVNRDLAHLQAAMNWARDVHGKTISNIVWKRLKVREAPHRVRFASGDEFADLLAAATPEIRPILICAVTTGLRKDNILRLEWHQVDLAGSTITLPTTKGGKPHAVPVAAALRATLSRTPPDRRKGPVFDTVNFRRRWHAAMKAAGLVDFHFHDLRHTFASWARQNGADLADICDALAHSSVSVTMRYAHIKPNAATTAFDRVNSLLMSQRKTQRRAK